MLSGVAVAVAVAWYSIPYQEIQVTKIRLHAVRIVWRAICMWREIFALWKASNRATQIAGAGEGLKISYEGGGSEKYIWIPGRMFSSTAPSETYLARVAGSLSCP